MTDININININTNINTIDIDKILNDEILVKVSKINLDEKKINYSEILYYSILFDDNTYRLILEKLSTNNNNIIHGIYKFESKNKIHDFLDNTNYNELNKNFDLNTNNQINKILDKLVPNDNFAIGIFTPNTTLYKLNEKFHTTILYTGGKEEPKALEFEPLVGNDVNLNIKSFGISDNFIVCGIEILDKSFPYYGNSVQHITIGLKKSDSGKFKLFPKDSPTAFDKGVHIVLDKPFEITGKIVKEIKEVKKVEKGEKGEKGEKVEKGEKGEKDEKII